MLKILTRTPATALTSHLVESVYYLILGAGVYLMFAPGKTSLLLGIGIAAVCAVWNNRRKAARGVQPSWDCEQPWAIGLAYMYGWTLCLLAGGALAAAGGHPATRIAGLVILGCGLAIEWTDHECRFNPRCTRRSSFDEMLDD